MSVQPDAPTRICIASGPNCGAIEIVIPGKPQPQQRIGLRRVGKFVQKFDPVDSASWKGAAQVHMRAEVKEPFDRAVALSILAVFPCPASDHRKTKPRERRWHTKASGDVDNVAKAVMDAGNGVLFLDDALVVELHVQKVIAAQGEAPRVVVWLREAGEAR